jgi:transcription antitermination factor NusG
LATFFQAGPVTDDGGSASAARHPGGAHASGAPAWYALRTLSNAHFIVRSRLEESGLETFLPTYTEESRWSDRVKKLARPLFPGYIFARVDPHRLREILATPGVVDVLPSRMRPEQIREGEIANVRRATESRLAALPCPYVAGDAVVVDRGPLAGVSGLVTRSISPGKTGTTRIIVGIQILNRAVSVEIDAADLKLPRGQEQNRSGSASPKGCDMASHAPGRRVPVERKAA